MATPNAAAGTPDRRSHGELVLDLSAGRAWWRGGCLALSPTEFRLLAALAVHPGVPVSAAALQQQLWGTTGPATAAYLALYVRYLHHELGDDPRHPRVLRGDKRGGYVLGAPAPAPAPAGPATAPHAGTLGPAAAPIRIRA